MDSGIDYRFMVVLCRQSFRLVSTPKSTLLYTHSDTNSSVGFVLQTSAGAVVLTDIVFWIVIVPFLSNTHLGLNMVRTFSESLY